jgi:uncharacterized protein YdeI (YjbR/CyaY-like superfamily)
VTERLSFFGSPSALRTWLLRSHNRARELWLGFHKKTSGKGGLTYAEALDEALCFGWIDGVRKGVDETTYAIRFTPRKPKSKWSAVNIHHATRLKAEGRMHPAGLAAFERRDPKRAGYSFEERPRTLPPRYAKPFKARKRAWAFFQEQAPSYRRTSVFWVVSAKKEETRERRLRALIDCSAKGERIPTLLPASPATRRAR